MENSELVATPTVQFRLLSLRDIVSLIVEGEDGQGRTPPLQPHVMALDRLQKLCPESGSRSGSFCTAQGKQGAKSCESGPIRDWLATHPRIQHAFIPVGAAWLNLIEGWWRIFRRKAFAGQSLADHADIAYVTRIATAQLNRHANPWVWGRPPPPHRHLRRCFVYRL